MKKKSYIFLIVIVAIFIVVGFFAVNRAHAPLLNSETSSQFNRAGQQETSVQQLDQIQQLQPQTTNPLPDALLRITKKPFGILIKPKTSPVQPERFSGYHNAVDLEITPEEQDIDVPVKVLCDGKLLMARTASGYGGVAAASCMLDEKVVTVVYGHINLKSVTAKAGDQLKAGDFLANLGKGFSSQTDGERKHLHFGIHKGASINILGYVQNKNQLNDWIDPKMYLQ